MSLGSHMLCKAYVQNPAWRLSKRKRFNSHVEKEFISVMHNRSPVFQRVRLNAKEVRVWTYARNRESSVGRRQFLAVRAIRATERGGNAKRGHAQPRSQAPSTSIWGERCVRSRTRPASTPAHRTVHHFQNSMLKWSMFRVVKCNTPVLCNVWETLCEVKQRWKQD